MNTSGSQRTTSKTALGVAGLRAVHQILDGQPKILDDPIAGLLLGDEIFRQIGDHPERAREPGAMGLRSYVVLRSRYAEDRLAEAVKRGVRQCVVLGAGFDTFAYRQPDWAWVLRIYEVDHQGTQEEKRKRLARAGIPVPDNLEFVAIDFETVSLRDGLKESSLDFSQPAFFSCLGVLVYLTQEAVEAVFRLIAGFPAGSEIAFTFFTRDPAVSGLAQLAGSLGEPWQSHFDLEVLRQNLRAWGFSEFSVLEPDDAERIYFQGRADGLHAPRRGSIATAVVAG